VETIRTHYLDASAIVKLLVNEPPYSEQLQQYFRQHSNFRTTSLCFAEALGVLKAKYFYRSEITQEKYLALCDELMALVHPDNIGIEIEEIEVNQRSVFREIEGLVKKYCNDHKDSIDVVDAFQIYTLKKGFFSSLKGGSAPILITADAKLGEATQNDGLKVWSCTKEPPP